MNYYQPILNQSLQNIRVFPLRVVDTETCISVHRGTADIDDVIHDLMSDIPRYSIDGWDKGFYKSYLEYKHIHNPIVLNQTNCTQWYFTGHSLGASVSLIASTELWNKISIIGLYTFGQPKTSFLNRPHLNQSNFFRIIDALPRSDSVDAGFVTDIVTSLPFTVSHNIKVKPYTLTENGLIKQHTYDYPYHLNPTIQSIHLHSISLYEDKLKKSIFKSIIDLE